MSVRFRQLVAPVVAVATVLAGSAACVDNRTAPLPPPVTAKSADLYGTWKGWSGSSLTLRPGGVAEAVDLDGQEFRFDDGWRMSGSGTWSLSEPGEYKGGNTVGTGSVVHVVVKPSVDSVGGGAAKANESPSSVPSDPASAATRTAPPPTEAAWDLSVVKDKSGKLELFFLTSDPDVRDKYYLSRR
ncbi:hypothetical protein [Streptomyces sp. WZ.A104]|uniref:hypothetical protein n=1 Tax=Streptomyces sp. WZ.A104 TaxID=2023771 RepID=UPI00117EEEA1|nr:hypothetical protein [Streptomyces sp. WZ.A104]